MMNIHSPQSTSEYYIRDGRIESVPNLVSRILDSKGDKLYRPKPPRLVTHPETFFGTGLRGINMSYNGLGKGYEDMGFKNPLDIVSVEIQFPVIPVVMILAWILDKLYHPSHKKGGKAHSGTSSEGATDTF